MANRERELEAQRVVYIRSDLYPDGEFVPELEARLSVFDRGYTIGDSVYEYGRTNRHSPFQVEEHMDRMFTSLQDAEDKSRGDSRGVLRSLQRGDDTRFMDNEKALPRLRHVM